MRRLVLLLLVGITMGQVSHHVNIISCVAKIIDDYVKHRTVVFLSEEENSSALWLKIVLRIRKPFMIVSKNEELNELDKFVLVLFPKSNDNYISYLKHLRKDTFFIVVGTRSFDRYFVTSILKQFHVAKMVHDIFLLPNKDKVDIFTSFPFSENHCAESGPPTKIDSYVNGTFVHATNLFDMKKYWNMFGCTLTCLGNRQRPDSILVMRSNGEIVFEGLTKGIMDILSQKLNFKPKIVLPQNNNTSLEHSWYFYNDTMEYILQYLANEQVDFAMGMFSHLAFSNHSAFYFGKESRFECYTWAVAMRSGKRRSVILNYIDEFTLEIWLLFVITVIFAVFITVIISSTLKQNMSLQCPLNAFHYIFATIFNQSLSVKPKSWAMRIFIAHWLVYILVISTAYQASLSSFITIPWHVHNIHSLEELIDSSVEIGGAQQMLNILKSLKNDNVYVRRMIDKFTILSVEDFQEIIDRIETKRDFAVFGEKRHLISYSKDINKIFLKERVHFIDGCLFETLVTPLLFPKGSPLYTPLNTMLTRLLQTGLVQRFGTLPGDHNPRDPLHESNDIAERHHVIEILTLAQARGVFLLLLLGYGLSFVVFVCELVIANISKRQNGISVIFGPKLYHRNLSV